VAPPLRPAHAVPRPSVRGCKARVIAPATLLPWSAQRLIHGSGRPSPSYIHSYALTSMAERQVVVLERDPPMPPRSDKPQADGEEYTATMRSRNGSPQFMHGHIYLKRGWEVRGLVFCCV